MTDEANVKVRARGVEVGARHAIVVGVDLDLEPGRRRAHAAADAARVAAVLRAQGYRVRTLHDGPGAPTRPTRAAVLAAVRATMRAAGAADVVVVYLAGRGGLVDGRPHLLLADTPADARGRARRALPLATLMPALLGRPRWVALLLDVRGLGLGLDPATTDAVAHTDERDGGFALLAASADLDPAQAGAGAATFSQHLAEGLAGAAATPDGAVTFGGLAHHVQGALATGRAAAGARAIPVLRLEVADPPLVPPHAYRALATPLPAKLGCAAFSPDGRWLATGSDDHVVRIWDARTGALRHPAMPHAAAISGVAFARDGRSLRSVSADGVVQVWDVARGTARAPAPPRLPTTITSVAWAPAADGRLLAPFADAHLRGLADDSVVDLQAPGLADKIYFRRGIWIRDGRGTRRVQRRGHDALAAAYLRAPGQFVTGGAGGELLRWRAATGTATKLGQHPGPVWRLVLSPDGRWLAAGGAPVGAAGPAGTEVRLWQPSTGAWRALRAHHGPVAALAFAPDSARLATGGHDGIIRIWAVADGLCLRALTVAVDGRLHHAEVWALAFAPDGRHLFAGYGDGLGRIFEV